MDLLNKVFKVWIEVKKFNMLYQSESSLWKYVIMLIWSLHYGHTTSFVLVLDLENLSNIIIIYCHDLYQINAIEIWSFDDICTKTNVQKEMKC